MQKCRQSETADGEEWQFALERVSFFMNRFRTLGFIEYNGRIRVSQIAAQRHSARLNSSAQTFIIFYFCFRSVNPPQPRTANVSKTEQIGNFSDEML